MSGSKAWKLTSHEAQNQFGLLLSTVKSLNTACSFICLVTLINFTKAYSISEITVIKITQLTNKCSLWSIFQERLVTVPLIIFNMTRTTPDLTPTVKASGSLEYDINHLNHVSFFTVFLCGGNKSMNFPTTDVFFIYYLFLKKTSFI